MRNIPFSVSSGFAARWLTPSRGLPLALVMLALSLPAFAHETPIALLELIETPGHDYYVQWTYSSSRNMAEPTVSFPDHCAVDGERLDCGERGLYGRVSMERLGVSYSAAVLRVNRQGEEAQSFTLTGAQPTVLLTAGGLLPTGQIAASYIPLGFEHILLGIDHLLFVLGLMLLVRAPWMMVKTITAFTVAHSITLAAATFGWVGVPESSVNAAIALSIVVVGVEVVHQRRGQSTWSAQFPWAVAFGFGLLHGFGFANALTEIGLPQANIPAALLFFNVGVELGQICFVFLVLALVWAHRQLLAKLPRYCETIGIYLMGTFASFWFISRAIDIVAPPLVLT